MEHSKVTAMLRSLDEGLQLFQQATPPTTDAALLPGRDQLKALLERVRADISKVGITCGGGATLSGPELQGLSETLVRSTLALTCCLHSFTSGAGPSLKEVLQKAAAGVIAPAKQLLQAMAKPGSAPSVHSCVSHCWGAIDSCLQIPLDNKTSIFKNITSVLVAMKDAVREMTELEQSTPSGLDAVMEQEEKEGLQMQGNRSTSSAVANGNGTQAVPSPQQQVGQGPPGGSGEDEPDDVVDFEAGQLGSSEAHTVRCAIQLVEAAGKVLRSVSKPLLRGPSLTPDSGLEAWESVLWHSRMMKNCCEDLGAALYPPQDLEEVRGAADGMFNSASVLLQEIPEVCAESLREEADALDQLLEAANQQFAAALQAAEAADE